MIPEEKSAAVTRGLSEAFGVTEFESISRITKGHTSSLVFRIIVRRSPYLLKIITRAEDPSRHYTSMKAAAEAGVAPRVLYASIPDHVCITDYIEAARLSRSEALVRLPALLRTLHALPRFGRAPFNTTCTFLLQKGPTLDRFVQTFRAARILPKAESDEFFDRYAQLEAVYRQHEADLVSSHNDLFKPDNILFDEHRVWLVDWEAAFLNDRYADLAAVANQVVRDEGEEKLFMREYLGATPGEYQLARLHLMQQISHLFYTMVFLQLGETGRPIDSSTLVPGFRSYQSLLWEGDVDLADKEVKIIYGRVHLERLLQNVRQARYAEALRIVSERDVASQGKCQHWKELQ